MDPIFDLIELLAVNNYDPTQILDDSLRECGGSRIQVSCCRISPQIMTVRAEGFRRLLFKYSTLFKSRCAAN